MSPNVRGKTGAIALVVASLACAGISGPAAGQARKLGAYAGTIEASHAHRTLTYRARARVTMPVSERKPERIGAEFLAGEAPPATIRLTQWDYFHRAKSADSSGTFVETKCWLAAPVEVPAMAMGVVNVDLRKKNYSLSISLTSTQEIAFDCSSTRQKAFKKRQAFGLAVGTGAPGMQSESPQPLKDPARLAARFTMDPSKQSGGQAGPVVQEWDLKLSP